MPTFAAIDIGSNSCRLAIASVQSHKLRTLHEDREVVRLGESVFDTGMISPEAMASTIRALKRFQKATQQFVVDRVRVVATSAMRDARNAAAFSAWVKAVPLVVNASNSLACPVFSSDTREPLLPLPRLDSHTLSRFRGVRLEVSDYRALRSRVPVPPTATRDQYSMIRVR